MNNKMFEDKIIENKLGFEYMNFTSKISESHSKDHFKIKNACLRVFSTKDIAYNDNDNDIDNININDKDETNSNNSDNNNDKTRNETAYCSIYNVRYLNRDRY